MWIYGSKELATRGLGLQSLVVQESKRHRTSFSGGPYQRYRTLARRLNVQPASSAATAPARKTSL